ncbi:YdcF family protein [Leptospira ryugenii]|nr:YdcF family protein [Leptospira ryugenii]
MALKRSTKRKHWLCLWLFVYGFSNAWVANFLISSLEKQNPPIPMEDVPVVETIVVLGGMINPLGIHSERVEVTDAADRLIDAVRLYRNGKAKFILFSGGSGLLFSPELKEAERAKRILLDLGIPESRILLEDQSRNTFENAKFSKEKLLLQKRETSLLVTSAFHMPRAKACFEKQGVAVFAYPTDYRALNLNASAFDLWVPSLVYWELSTIATKEWIGIWAYRFKAYMD